MQSLFELVSGDGVKHTSEDGYFHRNHLFQSAAAQKSDRRTIKQADRGICVFLKRK